MNYYIRRILWCLFIIVVTILLTLLFDYFFPNAAPFVHNLGSLIQVSALLGTIITLLQSPGSSPGKKYRTIFFVLLFILVPESLISYWLHNPGKIPDLLRPSLSYYYSEACRNVIQFNPECSIYDRGLFYTLKRSARFTYNNYEFTDSFITNRYGLRDDESSLIRPEIICLGDSYTMGWGVQQDETFAELLSKQSGYKVLNTGISSYGTARELKNLYRLDTTNLKYIIIQYCHNDYEENKAFVDSGYNLKISSQDFYQSACELNNWNKYWFPGKHFISFFKLNVSRKLNDHLQSRIDSTTENRLKDQAGLFTDILAHSAIDFSRVKVFVIDLNEKPSLNNNFINAVNNLAASEAYKKHFQNNLVMVPVADLLTQSDFYILDPHLRATGHQKIANRLISIMSQRL